MTDLETIKRQDHRRKIRVGLIMGLLCAIYWGIWYVPGSAVWNLDIMSKIYINIGLAKPDMDFDTVHILACVFLTGLNAIFCALMLFLWNGALHKLPELKRELFQVRGASKYFMAAAICGATAVFGTYLAASFLSPGFAAIAGLLYPVIGTILSVLYLKQKVSKRGYLSILILLSGGITLYSGSLITGGTDGSIIGILGGVMAAFGWGLEGICAGKALDVCEPDVGLHLRFIFEAIFWVVVLGAIALAGVPILDTIGELLDPTTFLVFVLLGLSFSWCYVCWYKCFPFLGVARGQAVGSLYAACAVIFLVIFSGPEAALGYNSDTMLVIVSTTILGLAICLFGSYLLASEDSEEMVSLRGE